MSDTYDVAIVGAGPSGSATAYYLAKTGVRVLLLDKFTFPRDKTCGDALTPRALRIISAMGITQAVEQIGHRLHKIEFFAPRGHSAIASLQETKDGHDHLLFAPRFLLDNILLERALSSGASFEAPVRVTHVIADGSTMLVQGACGSREKAFRTHIVVIATGASTKLLLDMGVLKRMPEMMLCARAYYHDLSSVLDTAQCRFDGVPLPGYGWVFPVSPTAVNVGVGIFRGRWANRKGPKTAHAAFTTFLQSSPLQQTFAGARQIGPLKGFPLRIDFAHASTFAERTLLVGEAAGLVNPVTGEGIDYALESGKLAAEYLVHLFTTGDFSLKRLSIYDSLLRERYQRLFVICDRLRSFYLNPIILNRVVRAVANNPHLMDLFMNIAIENQNLSQGLAPATIAQVLLSSAVSR
ncbi:MAG: geranylgeranyl reductase family protein [Ktedonobacteraceae bacterium]